jgi:large subunit ribosomal protein L13
MKLVIFFNTDLVEDCGDYVVVINAKKVHLTGNKAEQKVYKWHTGWPGGLKKQTYQEKLLKNPEYPITKAVYGMIPPNKHRKRQMSRLYIFPDEFHPYEQNILKDYENYDGNTLSERISKMITEKTNTPDN